MAIAATIVVATSELERVICTMVGVRVTMVERYPTDTVDTADRSAQATL